MRFGRIHLMRVHGESMLPGLRAGDLVLVRHTAYRRQAPQRGEVVAARPAALGGRAIVKRIAALPHDTATVDGRSIQLGDREYLLLGDHTSHSLDSRQLGPVSDAELIGPVCRRVWPLKRWVRPTRAA